MTQIKATPAEVEITSIVNELLHDGFIELDQADIITLEQRTHEGYKYIADLFEIWALGVIMRRKEERMADYARLAAEIDAWDEAGDEALINFEAGLLDSDSTGGVNGNPAPWHTTTTEDVGDD